MHMGTSFMYRLQEGVESLNRKVDTLLLNQARILRKFLPHEKRIERPEGLPSLPLKDFSGLRKFEDFLDNGLHFSATVSFYSF